jgi:hypothetical protein
VHPWGSSFFLFFLFLGKTEKNFKGNTITFLIPRTALRGFFRLSPTENNALQHATPEGFETAGDPVAVKGYSQLMGIQPGMTRSILTA